MLKTLNDIEFLEGEKSIGSGAFSTVHKVRSKIDNKIYALKKVDIEKLCKKDTDNLKTEIKFHRSFNHPNIINFVDCLQVGTIVYILLEYARNGSLFHFNHSKHGIPEQIALRFLYQTALAVKYLHDKKIIHRDIKPENILLDDVFNIKLADFGWSCYTDNKSIRTTIAGTFEYMPPEIANEEFHDEKADTWALGILLYELLHGDAPFKAQSLKEIKHEINTKDIKVDTEFSKGIRLLLNKLLAENKERYTVYDLLNDPVITDNIKNFERPLNEKEYTLLITNFTFNMCKIGNDDIQSKEVVKEMDENIFINTVVEDGTIRQIKIPKMPQLAEMDEKFFVINKLVKSNIKKVKRRNSANAVDDLKNIKQHDNYKLFYFAKQNFMIIPIIEIAIDTRASIHPSGKIIVFEREINWLHEFHRIEKKMGLEGKIRFVIYFSDTFNCYIVSSIRHLDEANAVRKLINKYYRGKSRDNLFKLTNLKDFIFCHQLGLYAGTMTLTSAVLVADMSLD